MHIRRLASLALVLALTACGGDKATDLQKYLHDQHQYAHDYSALNGATYAYDNGAVTIRTRLYTEASDAQDVCNWASEWLYTGDRDGSIKVLNRDGDILSQRRAESDVCSFG